MLQETSDGKSMEGLLYELIVVEGKYLTHPQLYDEVIHLLKSQPTKRQLLDERIESSKTRGCCYKFCCTIPMCCLGNCITKLFLRMSVFLLLITWFTGFVVYIFKIGE